MVESINVLVPSTLKLPGILTVSLESPKVKVPKLPFNADFTFAAVTTWDEPLTTPVPPNKVSSVILPPNDTEVPLIVIDELANLPFAIEPANCAFVIVPLKFDVA